ncbi:unnamed protein product [Rotaria socialis]|uniref:Uncharacterized protein n=1 Tax=Rotaria socialis TaxID=392032 RepID=A0A820Y7X6_9BILA|nr:unnamed protein product [Rotaria socialis]
MVRWPRRNGTNGETIIANIDCKGAGNSLTPLSSPRGVLVDQLGTVYVTDGGNDQIMRWPNGATQRGVIVGENG